VNAYATLAFYYVNAKRPAEAFATMDKVLARKPDPNDKTRAAPPNAHFRFGELLARKGNNAEARREFEAALQLNPKLEAANTALTKLPR
jgi:tetratricopeptide (TPR) repeat protein